MAWFEPALDRVRSVRRGDEPSLSSYFSSVLPLTIARAPGRLDVMGGIADYSGAVVLELPLACATWAVVQRQAAPRWDVVTHRDGDWQRVAFEPPESGASGGPGLVEWLVTHGSDRWAGYVLGVIQLVLERGSPGGNRSLPGFRVLIDSTVPEGKGVASSAALEVAVGSAVGAICDLALDGPELAAGCQYVENHVVGAPCGIMDQMTSVCGRRDRLLRLRCQPGTIEGHLEIPAGFRVFGIDSGIRHAVSGADYGTVRTAAFMGYRMIAAAAGLGAAPDGARVRIDDPRWHGYLANLAPSEFASLGAALPETMSGDEFLRTFGGITDRVTTVDPRRRYPVRRATEHPVREQQRVTHFAELLGDVGRRPEAAVELGHLMLESHKSYGACGLGSDGTDRLVELVVGAGAGHGLFGAKITGGGSGGTVAVFGRDEAEPAVRAIAERYRSETGRASQLFSGSGPGVEQAGVLCLDPEDFR